MTQIIDNVITFIANNEVFSSVFVLLTAVGVPTSMITAVKNFRKMFNQGTENIKAITDKVEAISKDATESKNIVDAGIQVLADIVEVLPMTEEEKQEAIKSLLKVGANVDSITKSIKTQHDLIKGEVVNIFDQIMGEEE